jgi:hypothetical protein
MITHKDWIIKYKSCKSKYIDAGSGEEPRRHSGNRLCYEWWPFGRRCTYRNCPKVNQEVSK